MSLFRRAEVEPTTEDQLIDDIGRRMLKRRVDALKSLPTFPDSVLRLNKLLSEDGAKESLQKIASAIETDPVLCARILRLVNSAFYGVSGAIITVFDALLMLGLDDAATMPDPVWGDIHWQATTTEGGTVTVPGRGYHNQDWRRAHRSICQAQLLQAMGRARSIMPDGVPCLVVGDFTASWRTSRPWPARPRGRRGQARPGSP